MFILYRSDTLSPFLSLSLHQERPNVETLLRGCGGVEGVAFYIHRFPALVARKGPDRSFKAKCVQQGCNLQDSGTHCILFAKRCSRIKDLLSEFLFTSWMTLNHPSNASISLRSGHMLALTFCHAPSQDLTLISVE